MDVYLLQSSGITPYPSVCLASRLTPDVHRLKRDIVPIVASSTAINKDKHHCACVWTLFLFLQMLGTHISDHNRAKTVRVYITLHPRQKQRTTRHCACVWMGFADGGTRISHHKRAAMVHMYITLHPRQKQRQNAIAHALWMDLQMVGHVYHTTIALRQSHMYILRFIHGKNKDKNAIAHAC